jgi:RNA polymerase sigma factor (sigma-70 family)
MTVTPDQSDSSLLQEFATCRSQDAFTELVSRHSDWVYSAALRMVRDRHLAEDVAQAVFLILADKAARLSAAPLHSWLFKVTRYASSNAIRARARRDKYERRAAMAYSETHDPNSDPMWQDISPILDDSINSLRSKDRDALLMRFYQQKNLAEVGAALGVSEGAAKVRVARAIEKLRGILRRRGIAAPADALGVALLSHATHAAPALFAKGFVPTAVSVKAAAISKGVTTMMISTKIKIAAAVLVIGSIPIGAGAYYMLNSANRSAETVTQQTVAQAPSAAESPAVAPTDQPPAAVNEYPGIDPRIAPFVTDRTDMIIAIDLTRLNLDAIAADMREEFSRTQPDPRAAAQINGMIQTGLGVGKQWINNFKQAGGSSLYLMSREDELSLGGNTGLKLSATVVYPTESPEAARTLAKYLTSPGSHPPKIVGNNVVDETSSTRPPLRAAMADPRPALGQGLLAGGNNPIRMAVNPLAIKDVMTKLMASGKISLNFAGDEWEGMESASINLVLPPAQAPGFLVISHYKDAASAEVARSKAAQRIANIFKPQTGSNSPITTAMLKFISSEKFSANGSDVVATMDLHAYWDMLFTAIQGATQPPTTRPHHPPRPTTAN